MTRGKRSFNSLRASLGSMLMLLLCAVAAEAQTGEAAAADGAESLSNWRYFQEVRPPAETSAPWVDFVLPPSVFDQARYDLGDLRLYTPSGREVPYALRERRPKSLREAVEAKEFNRTSGPDGPSELSLDLNRSDVEHNEVSVQLPGDNYRRYVELEGSNDGQTWRPVRSEHLISFQRGSERLTDRTISYSPSRYRYLRLRVFPDAQVDDVPVEIGAVSVLHTVSIPGEMLTLSAEVGQREPVPAGGGPGSAWILTLGGNGIPVGKIEVSVEDDEFVRNYHVATGGPPESQQPFRALTSGVWRRRAGEEKKPMIVTFAETRAARLRLVVTDHRNPPLRLSKVTYTAPARTVIFASPTPPEPLRLYFGNPKARSPVYDFAGNLPQRLEPKPDRTSVSQRRDNPMFVPAPLPFTERWPWLIYVVLSAVSIVLGAIIVNLSRAAIAQHDDAVDSISSAGASD